MKKLEKFELINQAKTNEKALLSLIEDYRFLLMKYASFLSYEDAYSDLLLDFIEMILKLDTNKFKVKNDFVITSYIRKSVHNAYLKKSKEYRSYIQMHTPFSEISEEQMQYVDSSHSKKDEYNELDNHFFLKFLTKTEHVVIKLLFYDGFSATDVAKMHCTTRQSINQTKLRALDKICYLAFSE